MHNYKEYEFNSFNQKIGMPVETPAVAYQPEALHGQYVQLLPVAAEHVRTEGFQALWEAIETEPDASCWTWLPYPGFDFSVQLENALINNFNFPGSHHFLIVYNSKILGWIALLNERQQYQAIEIGNVYFSHRLKRTTATTEVMYLLLNSCFEQGFRRVEWKCDDLNEPSMKAAYRFGFQYEGTFRQDRISKGRNRNTAWFSVLDHEWDVMQKSYQAWLDPSNFNVHGQQLSKLKISV